MHGFIYTLLKPKAKLHKVLKSAINSGEILQLLKACTKIFAANLPTLMHKIIQMVEPLLKEDPTIGPIFIDWWGKKLTYPMMGDIEIDNVFDKITIPAYSFKFIHDEHNGLDKRNNKLGLIASREFKSYQSHNLGYYLNI